MRVTIPVKAYYDWEPVPDDVKVTESDKKSGKVKPGSRGGWQMKVKKVADTHAMCGVSEGEIIRTIIDQAMPNQGSKMLSRKEALAKHLSEMVMPHHAHPSFMKAGIEVDDDGGPDKDLFMALVGPYSAGDASLIPPEVVPEMLAKYMEPADHAEHLHQAFNLKRPS